MSGRDVGVENREQRADNNGEHGVENQNVKKVAIYVCGGLGNQLFQFACLLAYCDKYHYQPVFDRKFHGELHTKDLFWEQFPPLRELIHEEPLDNPCWMYQENDSVFQEIPFIPENYKSALLRGYFNDERYFLGSKEKIVTLFTQCFAPYASNSCVNKIGIHARRGDYLKYQNVFHLLDKIYYQRALQLLPHNLEKCFVSEDKAWCKSIFSDARFNTEFPSVCHLFNPPPTNVETSNLETPTTPPTDMNTRAILEDFCFLMACKFVVIANSTFSWWAAYLNPFVEKVVYPMEWFSGHLRHTFKYNVGTEEGKWKMVTNKECNQIFSLLEQYITANQWEHFHSIMSFLDFPFACENDIFEWKHYHFVAQKDNVSYQELLSFSTRYQKPLSRSMKQHIHQFLPQEVQLMIDMKQIPLYVITGQERLPHMLARFETKKLTPIIVPSVPCQEKCEGCTKAHLNALNLAIEKNIFPCVIFEDDVVPTPDYKEVFKIPKADAVYIGLSRHGMGGWNQMGIRGFIRNSMDANIEGIQFYQIYNMLSAHAIIYVNKEYACKMAKAIEMCLTLRFINDVATARLQDENYVVAVEKAFFVQDVLYAKDKAQRQNNLETYVSMTEFPHS